MAKRQSKRAVIKSSIWPEETVVPKYLLREGDSTTDILGIHEHLQVCSILAPRVDTRIGIRAKSLGRWQSDPAGLALLKRAVRTLLIEPGRYKPQELKNLTTKQLLVILGEARVREDELLRVRQKAELQPMRDYCLQHRDFLQQQVRKAVADVKQYLEARGQGRPPERVPFPNVVDEDLSPLRPRDMDDIPWACFVLGLKLEGIFGISGAFVPKDLWSDIDALGDYISPLVYDLIDGRMPLHELNDLWLMIRTAMPAETVNPTSIPGGSPLKTPATRTDNSFAAVPADMPNKDEEEGPKWPQEPPSDGEGRGAEKEPQVDPPEDALMSPRQLASQHGVPYEALRKRLERERRRNHNCFVEVEAQGNEPQFLYRYEVIKHVIDSMK